MNKKKIIAKIFCCLFAVVALVACDKEPIDNGKTIPKEEKRNSQRDQRQHIIRVASGVSCAFEQHNKARIHSKRRPFAPSSFLCE